MKNGTAIYIAVRSKWGIGAEEMILFKRNVKEIKGPLTGFLKAHVKPEHQREFE